MDGAEPGPDSRRAAAEPARFSWQSWCRIPLSPGEIVARANEHTQTNVSRM
jgi:hypothetical protein